MSKSGTSDAPRAEQQANKLFSDYANTGSLDTLKLSVAAWQSAVDSTPATDEALPRRLWSLAKAIREHYRQSNNLEHIEKAIALCERAIRLIPENSQETSAYFSQLGQLFHDRYLLATGSLEDLRQGIFWCQRAVNLCTSPSLETAVCYFHLGNLCRDTYIHTAYPGYIDSAIDAHHEAVRQCPDDSPALAILLTDLGNDLRERFDHGGREADLKDSISALEDAVTRVPASSPDRPWHLTCLGIALDRLYETTGDENALDRMLEVHELAVSESPEAASDIGARLSNLGNALDAKYQRTGEVEYLHRRVSVCRQAVDAISPTSPYYARFLSNLGNALGDRYSRLHQRGDLDEMIVSYEQAKDLTPHSSKDWPGHVSNLSIGLRTRFRADGELTDLEGSVEYDQQACDSAPEDSPGRSKWLGNLGVGLHDLYEQTQDARYLERSVSALSESIKVTKASSPEHPSHLNSLGSALASRYRLQRRPSDLQEGQRAYREAAKRALLVDPYLTIMASRNLMHWAFERQSWDEVVEAFAYTSEASDILVSVQLLRTDKLAWLTEIQGLPALCTYALAKTGRLREAIEVLEGGVARLLTESLSLHAVGADWLENADQKELRQAYERALARWRNLTNSSLRGDGVYEELRRVRNEIQAILNKFQEARHDAEPFSLTSTEILTTYAPIAYVLATSEGGLAILIDHEYRAVWLPGLTNTALDELFYGRGKAEEGYLSSYWASKQAPDTPLAQTRWLDTLDRACRWLWDVLFEPIHAALPHEPRRLTVVPVGRLGALPLHAAWTEDLMSPAGRRYVLDTTSIIYTPNVRALIGATVLAETSPADSLLAVTAPQPSDWARLPGSILEAAVIKAQFSESVLLAENRATREGVLESLVDHSVVHFSCHGSSDLQEPLKSGLYLANDEPITLQDILKVQLKKTRLVTLSACETGLPGVQLPDEVVSLPAGLMEAGVAGVVGSLWAVDDLSTMLLMMYFYEQWRTRQLAPNEALRAAQKWVRDATDEEIGDFLRRVTSGNQDDTEYAMSLLEELTWGMAGFDSHAMGQTHRSGSEFAGARRLSHPFFWAAFVYVGA